MKLSRTQPRPRRLRAFTLVEILTAVAITTIIVFTLMKMFDTSTKALHVANRQTDVWESARATFGILRQNLGEVATGGAPERINLFSANRPADVYPLFLPNQPVPVAMRRQDLYILSRENNQWNVNVYLLGKDRLSDLDTTGVRTLYRFQTNFPVYPAASVGQLGFDLPILNSQHPFPVALEALDRHLAALDSGNEPDGTISVMARGIVHLRLVTYAADGRAFTNYSDLPTPPPLPVDHFIDPDTVRFQDEMLPASMDLELFVLHPDRIEEFRSQAGPAAQRSYVENHTSSIQLFRTRIPVRRDLLARQ